MTFEEFSNDCLSELSENQDKFMHLYAINSYEHWHYDHGIGIFHFYSDDGRHLYFRYIDVGSYSSERNTWMWSWDNSSTPPQVTKGLDKVKAYGEANQFAQLSVGLMENADEYTGWSMMAITAKFLPAIGAYRIAQEHLFIYFIFTEELTQEQYQELKEDYVECDTHGTGRIAFVCQHLLAASNIGFREIIDSSPADEHTDNYQAWCDDCEQAWGKVGDWTDDFKTFVNLKIVCEQCYFEIKGRN